MKINAITKHVSVPLSTNAMALIPDFDYTPTGEYLNETP